MADKAAPHWSHDPDVCKVCLGMPLVRPDGCEHCGNTGKEPQVTPLPLTQNQKIVPIRADIAHASPATSAQPNCLCQQLRGYASPGALCPLCGGSTQLPLARLAEVYDLVMRHIWDLRTLDGSEAIPAGKPITDAIIVSGGWGAYTETIWRFYVECVAPGLVMVSQQDIWRPVGRTMRMFQFHRVALADIPARWPDMPPLDAPIWQPLPMDAAWPAMKTWKGGKGA